MRRTKGYAENDYSEVRAVMAEIQQNAYGSYGYRRMTRALQSRGYTINHKVVQRLMREEGIGCTRRTAAANESEVTFSSYRKNYGKKAADLINRDFKAEHFGEKWSTDMTEIRMEDRKIYLSVVIDNYNSEVVGYNISDKPDLMSVLSAIGFARKCHGDVTPVVHSDRGWFYCTNAYIGILKKFGYKRSMTESGSCYDNAVVESFFAQLKTELIYTKKWKSFKELCRAIHNYIKFYNNERLKASLGYKSPVGYRLENSVVE